VDRTVSQEIYDRWIGSDVRLGVALFPVQNRPGIDTNASGGLFLVQPKVKPSCPDVIPPGSGVQLDIPVVFAQVPKKALATW